MKDFIIKFILEYGIKTLVKVYNEYGEQKVLILISRGWYIIDQYLDNKINKDNSGLIQKDLIDILEKSIEQIKLDIKD